MTAGTVAISVASSEYHIPPLAECGAMVQPGEAAFDAKCAPSCASAPCAVLRRSLVHAGAFVSKNGLTGGVCGSLYMRKLSRPACGGRRTTYKPACGMNVTDGRKN